MRRHRRVVLVVRGGRDRAWWRIVVPATRRLPELSKSLTECAAGVGQALGSEDQECDYQDDDQVAGLEDAGEQDAVLCEGVVGRRLEERRPTFAWGQFVVVRVSGASRRGRPGARPRQQRGRDP